MMNNPKELSALQETIKKSQLEANKARAEALLKDMLCKLGGQTCRSEIIKKVIVR